MHMGDGRGDAGEDGGIIVFLQEVIGVEEETDARVGDFLHHAPRLGHGVDDVGFAAVKMLDRDGEAVLIGK